MLFLQYLVCIKHTLCPPMSLLKHPLKIKDNGVGKCFCCNGSTHKNAQCHFIKVLWHLKSFRLIWKLIPQLTALHSFQTIRKRWEEIPPCETLILKHLSVRNACGELWALHVWQYCLMLPLSLTCSDKVLQARPDSSFWQEDNIRPAAHRTSLTVLPPSVTPDILGVPFTVFKGDRWERNRSSLMLLKGKKSSSNCLATSEQHLTHLDS